MRRRKLFRRAVSQTAVRALLVVLDLPRRDLTPRIKQILKPAHRQALIPQPSVKALNAPILRRLSRLYVQQLDLPFHTPRQKMPAGELRPVVAADRSRHPTLGDDRIQHTSDSPAGKARIHFQSQALSRVRIHHAQHPDRPSALHRIMHKIQRPLLVRRSPRHQRLSPPPAMLPLFPPQHQPRLPIDPMQPLVIHPFSTSSQQNMQPPIPEARLRPRQPHQQRAQRTIPPSCPVAITRYRHPHQPANPALARCVLAPQPVRVRPLVYELHPFFAITAFSISLSKLRSTTSFFNLVFSSRNCLASCASLTVMPPYFAFQA